MLENGEPKALIIGKPDDPVTGQMHGAALSVFRMGKIVEVMTPQEAEKTDYPPARDGKPIAYICTDKTCAPPVRETAKISDVLKSFGKPKPSSTQAPAGDKNSGSSE